MPSDRFLDHKTNPLMFARLRDEEPEAREIAWQEFHELYAPLIAGFAKRFGARPQEIDDIIQDVTLKFFGVSKRFQYDRSKGTFRGFLKVITLNIIRDKLGRKAKLGGVPVDALPDDAPTVTEVWEEESKRALLDQAVRELRAERRDDQMFQAWEKYVLLRIPARDVAASLNVSENYVHQAKSRLSRSLRERVKQIEGRDG